MVNFQQQRAIDAALLSMSNPNNKSQQDTLSMLLTSPEANAYANSAMSRMGLQGASTSGSSGGNMRSPSSQSRPYDGPGMTATVDGQGMGGYGLTADVFTQLFGGAPQQSRPTSGSQPQTYSLMNPSEFGFGFGNGVPGGDVVQFLQDAGFPDVNLIQAIQQGQALQQTDYNRSAQSLGGVALPSMQGLSRLGPSGMEFLLGLYATMLGIPEEDILYGAMQPFMGLGGAPQARQMGGYIR